MLGCLYTTNHCMVEHYACVIVHYGCEYAVYIFIYLCKQYFLYVLFEAKVSESGGSWVGYIDLIIWEG